MLKCVPAVEFHTNTDTIHNTQYIVYTHIQYIVVYTVKMQYTSMI